MMVARHAGMLLAGAALGAVTLVPAAALGSGEAHTAAKPRRPPTTAVGVGEREFRLAAYRTSVPAGTVRFNVANEGEDVHDLVVRSKSGRRLARSIQVRPGSRTTLSVKLPPGTYTLLCDLANHAALGMHTTIRVR